ncbi:aminopeptidase C [Pengzhenrongella frigida]|uniref:Aminopeptidase n=1 Tax=Pengzhenrongella frigida TaxID=1259133 RepID=A0A4Q5MVB8_9MICO|nr:C1 family peptidase [Cellulomonas sp. HLT2-17]RYV49460.1 aminopeptidase [Cellulomonas sp. HLT2-17]
MTTTSAAIPVSSLPLPEVPGALTGATLRGFADSFASDATAVRMQNAVTRSGLDEVAANHARQVSLSTTMSNRLDDWTVANQKKSGRCWLFAALNLFRCGAREVLGVKEFEFSQSHAMFWDKLERVNYFMADVIATAERPVDDRLVTFLLAEVMGDGGQWNMAASVFAKHGVVPKEAMPETESSGNTTVLNRSLRSLLHHAACTVRTLVADGADTAAVEAACQQVVADAYRILAIHLGTPPDSFDWQWRDDAGSFHRDGGTTPQEFFAKYVTIPVAEYVCLVDDPRPEHPKGGTLTIERLGNVVGGDPVLYLNTEIALMKRLAMEAIVAGEPVWFGCDVSQQMLRKEGLWSADLLDLEGVYGVDLTMTKEDRVRFGESMMTHAMLLTGVDVVGGVPRRWRVENSWGDAGGDKGFFTMDDSWFDEYVFEVVVRTSALPAEYRTALGAEPVALPAWDPMGALA